MGIVRTDKWFRYYHQYWDEQETAETKYKWQQKLFIQPLQSYFSNKKLEDLHHYFLSLGLVHPTVDVSEAIQKFAEHKKWHLLQREYERLKEKWSGPDIPIYLFPIDWRNKTIQQQGGKMGVSTENMICLFIDPTITNEHMFALFTHEYHHVCRLAYTKQSEQSISLLESMIMEGLAEYAVKEELGDAVLSPWVERYSEEQCKYLYENLIKSHINVTGRHQYRHILNGDKKLGIPPFLGYAIGYFLVDSIVKKDDYDTLRLLTMSTDSLFDLSFFSEGGG